MFDILFFTHLFNGLLMIVIPIALGIFLSRRFKLGWRLWLIGGATFIISQIGHIPFNYALTILFQQGVLPLPPEGMQLIFNSIVLGLSAGLWESMARYATYRWWITDARTWAKGVLVGAGHGGVEAIILGVLVMGTFVGMVIARNMDPNSIVPSEQVEVLQNQLDTYWNLVWYYPFLGVTERIFSIIFHISASLLILQVFIRHQIFWLWLAIIWHALVDGVAFYASQTLDPFITEAVIGSFALISLGIILAFRQSEENEAQYITSAEPSIRTTNTVLPDIEENPETLDQSRF